MKRTTAKTTAKAAKTTPITAAALKTTTTTTTSKKLEIKIIYFQMMKFMPVKKKKFYLKGKFYEESKV